MEKIIFEKLSGYTLTDADFNVVYPIYKNCDGQDPKEFMEMWNDCTPTQKSYFCFISYEADRLKESRKTSEKKILDLSEIVLRHTKYNEVIREIVANHISAKDYLRILVKNNVKLTEKDCDLLLYVLSSK